MAIVDFEGTLAKLPIDWDKLKKEIGYKDGSCVLDLSKREQYPTVEKYELEAIDKAEEIKESKILLSKLIEHGYFILVLSNSGEKVVNFLINKFGMLNLIDKIITREEAKHHKPDSRSFTDFYGGSETPGEDSIVIGDTWRDEDLAINLKLPYYKSVSEAMIKLGFRKSLHNDQVYANELWYLLKYCDGFTLDVGCGSRPAGDINIDLMPMNDAIFQMDIRNLNFRDEIFDSVIAIHSIEHVEMVFTALSEFNRVLKKDGMLGVVVPVKDMSYFDETHITHYSPNQWITIIETWGFEWKVAKNFYTIFDGKRKLFSTALIFQKVK